MNYPPTRQECRIIVRDTTLEMVIFALLCAGGAVVILSGGMDLIGSNIVRAMLKILSGALALFAGQIAYRDSSRNRTWAKCHLRHGCAN